MPRLARLDAPGILHHVMGRGIERKKILINDTDRNDFIDRLAALAEEGAMDVYAWVLIRGNPVMRKKYRTAMIVAFVSPFVIGMIFKYFLLVPMPSEGLVVAVTDYFWYFEF